MMTNDNIGIDISKSFLDAHRLSDGGTATFPNAPAGFRALAAWLGCHMPALVATKHNPDMRDKYKAMIDQGKPKKVALTAIMRKLIELANALVKADREWIPNRT